MRRRCTRCRGHGKTAPLCGAVRTSPLPASQRASPILGARSKAWKSSRVCFSRSWKTRSLRAHASGTQVCSRATIVREAGLDFAVRPVRMRAWFSTSICGEQRKHSIRELNLSGCCSPDVQLCGLVKKLGKKEKMKMKLNKAEESLKHGAGAILSAFALLLVSCSPVHNETSSEAPKPNFSGVWKIRVNANVTWSEVYSIAQNGEDLRLSISIEHGHNPRVMNFNGKIDGQEYKMTILGNPARLIAQWQGNNLVAQTIREEAGRTINIKRVLMMAPDSKMITEERTSIGAGGEESSSVNILDRQ